jgi:predicted unusual protein kinase regulating ubiquinone biosynthesis (AarF/ABC1/UbiB family)
MVGSLSRVNFTLQKPYNEEWETVSHLPSIKIPVPDQDIPEQPVTKAKVNMKKSRFRRILFFFARWLLGIFIMDLVLPKVGFRKFSERTRSKRLGRFAAGFHHLAVSMGGVLIKVGQFLSARADVLPIEITDELEGLQDEVPPENFGDLRTLAERELGKPLDQIFAAMDETPLAAASLGQVHRARLLDNGNLPEFGSEVVVKIQRPDIESLIATDLGALQVVSRWVMRYKAIQKRVDIPSLLAEFTSVLYQEIDYLAEGRNAEKFAQNFLDFPGVRVPGVVWTHTTKRVLTLEDVYAIKITDYDDIEASGVDRQEVAERVFDAYMRQIFEHGFFHADPHPGNLFVDPIPNGEEASWQLTFVDFGMVGYITPTIREGLREIVIALGTKDSKRMVKAYQLMDMLLPTADLELIEQAEAAVFERFWGKSMDELTRISFDEFHDFAKEFRELAFEMPFQIPQNLIFLLRMVAILSGICTGLNREFNFWEVINPYAEKLVKEEVKRTDWLAEAGAILQTIIALPRKTEALIDRMNRGRLNITAPGTDRRLKQIEHSIKRVPYAILCVGLLNGGIQLFIHQQISFAALLFAAAGVSLLGVIFPLRNPHDR